MEEILKELNEIKQVLESFFPKKADIKFISDRTGLSRQTIRNRLIAQFEPEVDFWVESNKIYVSKKIMVHFLRG